MEEESIDHFIHEHPLTLIQSHTSNDDFCYGCERYFFVEATYGCTKCGNRKYLHTDCAERPIQITHSLHPQHTLLQKLGNDSRSCAVCDKTIWKIGYFCTSSGCGFQIHMHCGVSTDVMHIADEQKCIEHPSHPQHELILVKKRHTFNCDACGTVETGRSYQCVACQYWIHEGCAALPLIADYYHHHHHPLSLAFSFPKEYIRFFFSCDICKKYVLLHRWVYHCQICRYVVHIKCAIIPPTPTPTPTAIIDDQGAVQFPFREVHEDLIKPFVIRERGGLVVIPRHDQKYSFPLHHHQLSLVSSPSISKINDDGSEDEEEDVELTCDACTMPIFHKDKHHQSSSSSSSSSSSPEYYKYMSCSECKYFLHLSCFNLPPEIPSHPLHKPHHNLILEASHKLDFWSTCSICYFLTNGLVYTCRECDFKADVKCTSLPTTIKHEAHPHHHLYLKFVPAKGDSQKSLCRGCVRFVLYGMLYKCGSCNFILCKECILLPPVNKHKWEKHPLPLTYNARFNHPGDFYCDACERQMNPWEWMYQCRHCDTSFHARCFPETSGYYQNIKFGQQYNVSGNIHPHPLTFRLLTTKLRCDVCRFTIHGADGTVDKRGFHCSSCNFFMCLHDCVRRSPSQISPIDSQIL